MLADRIETFDLPLPHGITLACRACGPTEAPLLVFLHGFPEGAFVWDTLLARFGDRYRCVAPNLRGYAGSSAPAEVAAYRAKPLLEDLAALIAALGAPAQAVIAHDWGGAVAWHLGIQRPVLAERLVMINSPHPGAFLRDLRSDPAQQAASAYMNFLARPDAEALMSADDYKRMWLSFTQMKAGPDGYGWLTEDVKAKYREVWDHGLTGALNLYRVTPMKPAIPGKPAAEIPELPRERLVVEVPTFVFWALDDAALLPGLLEGLEDYVPKLDLKKVPDATHWILHEQPEFVAREIEAFLRRTQ